MTHTFLLAFFCGGLRIFMWAVEVFGGESTRIKV